MIYFDNSATTPLSPSVFEKMKPYFVNDFGNPESNHILGKQAKYAVELAREQVASAFFCKPQNIFFTSGGTESDNWALASLVQTGKTHVISSPTEHKAILTTLKRMKKAGFDITLLPVDGQGRVNPENLEQTITPKTALVTIMAANNETGTIQPFYDIYQICKQKGVLYHCDAVQAFGKIPIAAGMADMVSISAHKFNGPKGIGVLIVKENVPLHPLITGGGQEFGLRGGTTPVPLAVGIGAACMAVSKDIGERAIYIERLGNLLEDGIVESIEDTYVNGFPASRIPGLINVCFQGVCSKTLVKVLSDKFNICCSSGSACSENSNVPSYVLRSCGVSDEDCGASVRFSLGVNNKIEEIEYVLDVLPKIIRKMRCFY